MDQNTVFFIMLGMLGVTYLPRLIPMWLFANKSLPPLVISWLRYVPVAVLAAMLLPTLLIHEGDIYVHTHNLFLWAAIPTFFVAWKTKSLFISVIVGMLIVAGARYVG